MTSDTERTVTRRELYEQVWSIPMSTLCHQYNLSDNGLRKICRQFEIPTPTVGHWAKLQHGKRSRKKVLKKVDWIGDDEPALILRGEPRVPNPDDPVAKAAKFEKTRENRIVVPSSLCEPLPITERTQRSLLNAKADEHGLTRPKAKKCLNIAVTNENIERALIVADTLLKSLQRRGFADKAPTNFANDAEFTIDGETFYFAISEELDRRERKPTPEESQEAEDWPWLADKKYYEVVTSGRLALEILGGPGEYCQRRWRDTKKRSIESCLNAFISGCHRVAEANKIAREKQAQQEREMEEYWRKRQIEERRRLEEAARTTRLED